MRCPDCNKFVPMSTDGEPEVNGDVFDTAYTCEVRLAHTCEECGSELRECNLEVSYDFSGNLPKNEGGGPKACSPDPDTNEAGEHEFGIEEEAYNATEIPVVGARGKPLKGRFTHGVEGNVIVRCAHCGMTVEFNVEHDGEEAGAFEECC